MVHYLDTTKAYQIHFHLPPSFSHSHFLSHLLLDTKAIAWLPAAQFIFVESSWSKLGLHHLPSTKISAH
jgi:hypothetical protein